MTLSPPTFLPAPLLTRLAGLAILVLEIAPIHGGGELFPGPFALDPTCEPLEVRYQPLPPGDPAPGTRGMAQLIVDLGAKMKPLEVPFLNDRSATLLESKLKTAFDIREKFKLQLQLGMQQTAAGRPDSGLNTYAALERLAATQLFTLSPKEREELRLQKIIAFLRLGEQENCLAAHNEDSCVFPLRSRAFHLLPRGSRGAISLLNEQLAVSPDDLASRWLLNLAHMTVGEYPAKVPAKFLIPPERFVSEASLPQFPDRSQAAGLDTHNLAGGVIIDDFDNDGLYDVVTSAWDLRGQLRFFHNNGEGKFVDRTSEAGLVGETCSLNIQQTDYNNDGLLDIWMLRGGGLGKTGNIPNSLLRNNGNGTFTDVTFEAGLGEAHPTQTSRWFDYDGDGWLDLFIGNESTDPAAPDFCELYHSNRDGTFLECSEGCGIHLMKNVQGVACADYDNDGRPDLYLSINGDRNILFHNEGPADPKEPYGVAWKFRDVTSGVGPVGEPVASYGTFFFDYDNDGWEDLFVVGYSLPQGVADVAADYLGLPNQGTPCRLFHNNRDGTFADVSKEAHMDRLCHAMGHNFGDIDNDGWLDFYCGTGGPDLRTLIPNRMFRNAEGKFFQDVTTATGTGHLQKGHGVAIADLDDDGDQDVYIELGGFALGDSARNALFENPGGNQNHWLKLKLTGGKSNRAALGARLQISLRTPQGMRELHRTVGSGGSFGSNPLRQEIGLGNATAIVAVNILWPGSGTHQTICGLELDHAYEIKEDEATPVALKLHPVKLGGSLKP